MTRCPDISRSSIPVFYAVIDADPYVLPLIQSALSATFPAQSYEFLASLEELPSDANNLLQIAPYECLDFTHLMNHPTTSLANSYVIRKALVRKHFLHNTIASWWSKHPNDTDLKGHVPLTVGFEVDYADFLDEALVECWELKDSWRKDEREWWVLKPGMSDQGQGVRLFSTEGELRSIFEEWDEPDSDHNEDVETPPAINGQDVIGAGIMTSQLRHFIAQLYIHPPLLLSSHGKRKFHIRSYVLAVGALSLYVYEDMLALFAPLPYTTPGASSSDTCSAALDNHIDPRVHLTNTCLQDGSREGSVVRFWDLTEDAVNLPHHWKNDVLEHICRATGTLFEAAAREQMIHFQTLGNAFEVFGIDWMVDEKGVPWLLEVNAFPDFKQSGEALKAVIQNLWNGIIGIAVKGYFNPEDETEGRSEEQKLRMRKVLDVDLGRR